MSDDLNFTFNIDDIPEYIFYMPSDEELARYIPIRGEDGAFKYEVADTLPETGEEGVLYFKPKPYTSQTATGNPINLNITEGAGKLDSARIDGDTFQYTEPSPNPDYPQAIQTVTGLQTVSINGTDYPIDLGATELCKLSTYHDYIWKDGDDWKVHKATGRATRDVEVVGIRLNNTSGPAMAAEAGAFAIFNSSFAEIATARASENIGVYKHDASITGNAGANAMTDGTFCQRQGTNDRCYFRNTAYIGKTGSEMKALLLANSGGANVYYYLSTPTDTTITDATLIAQLEAVANARLASGSNTISNSATSPNLAGDLEVSYHGYDPVNKYDKYVWLDLDNSYEQI